MNYTVLVSANPTIQKFLPFSDSISVNNNPSFCGQKTYQFVKDYKFLKITPPLTGDEFVDAWQISLSTIDLKDVSAYEVTLECKLADYPNVKPAKLDFTVNILHPCTTTKINPIKLKKMVYTLGSQEKVIQDFFYFSDTIGIAQKIE